MSLDTVLNEELVRRLPLPLAKLYRHAANAKSALDRHQAAYFLWEAALKLLAITAIVCYADRPDHDPKIAEQLKSLSRPSLGEWRKYVRVLLPILASDEENFCTIQQLLGESRDDLPRLAGLDAVLREALESKSGARSTVRLDDLFDRLVTYRNNELGHGAAGLRAPAHYDRMGRAILAGVGELLEHLDVLAGNRLVYFAEGSRAADGNWIVERLELIGETARRIAPLEFASAAEMDAVVPGRVYFEVPSANKSTNNKAATLHPLAIYEPNFKDLLLLNSQRNRKRCDYLCYSSGEVVQIDRLSGQMSELLSRIFGATVDADQVDHWAEQSLAESAAEKTEQVVGSRSIGEFELFSKLGQGGMGVVYRAWQPSVGRQVALKCLLRAGDPKSAARFAQEYRTLGRVDHPHLVKVFTSGAEGDQWFYAMELIDGATLAAVCERLQSDAKLPVDVAPDTWRQAVSTTCEEARRAERPLSNKSDRLAVADVAPAETAPIPPIEIDSYVRHVVELVRQTASAAQKLHEAGVVHRDIKPGNVMLTADGSHAVLMDLGLAQWIDRKITGTRQFVGTLRYASPEQVLGAGRLDGRSDVYSLGVTLWELLTLRPMFGATDDTPTPELMKRIQFDEAELVGKYHSGIAADLQAIVAKCLEKNPAHRYESAAALADDLGRWLRDEPVLAQPTNWRYRTKKFLRRNRKVIGAVTALVLLQAIVVGALLHATRQNASSSTTILSTANGTLQNTKSAMADGKMAVPIVPASATVVPFSGKRRAVLIGCSYSKTSRALSGSANDVALFKETLIARFGFAPADIRTMLELGSPDPKSVPTKDNIEVALRHLAGDSSAGDQAVVVFEGSAVQSQVYQYGVESVFLPSDATVEDRRPAASGHRGIDLGDDLTVDTDIHGRRLTNVISDAELNDWLSPLVEKKASIWIISDTCAGGIGRLLAEHAMASPLEPNSVVAMFASQSNETVIDMPLPKDAPGAVPHGLFSFFVCQALSRGTAQKTPEEIIATVRQNVATLDLILHQTPWCTGRGIERPILPGSTAPPPDAPAVPAKSDAPPGFKLLDISPPADTELPTDGKNVALLFGNGEYDGSVHGRKLSKLMTPRVDVEAIQAMLADHYGFKTYSYLNQPKQSILASIGQWRDRKEEFGRDSEMLIYFSGHGIFDRTTGRAYLIAKDSQISDDLGDQYKSCISLDEELGGLLNAIPCRHIFLVFDSTFGTTIPYGSELTRVPEAGGLASKLSKQEISSRLAKKCRLCLFSASSYAQLASDGQPSAHSPFTAKLLGFLGKQRSGDVVTAAMLYDNIAWQKDQRPRFAAMSGNEGGDFLLIRSDR